MSVITGLFQLILTQPIYNGFVFLIGIVPGGSVGLAIILLTLFIRLLFYPLFTSSIRSQMAMNAARAELDEINARYKDKPDEVSRRTMEVFKKHRIKPLSLFLSPVVQILVLIALSIVFYRLGLPAIREDLLYPFVNAPALVNIEFLGFSLTAAHNIPLGLLVGVLQYLALYFTFARMGSASTGDQAKDQSARMQRFMMLYVMPVIIAFVSYTLPSAAGLYFAVTSVVSIAQEWVIRRKPL